MALFAVSLPIPSGKLAQWKEFTGALMGARKAEFVASRKALGVRERTFIQQTPMGDFVIVTLEGNDPAAAFGKFGQGTDAFTTWFKRQVMEIHNVDLAAPPPGPLPTQVVELGGVGSRRTGRFRAQQTDRPTRALCQPARLTCGACSARRCRSASL